MISALRSLRGVSLACLLLATMTGPALALDKITLANEEINGDIQSMTRDAVVIKPVGSSEVRSVPTEEIVSIIFSGEPAPMRMLTSQMELSNFAGMTRTLEMDALNPSRISNDRVKAEVGFYSAYAAAQNALSGAGDLEAAGRTMRSYVDANPNHWRYYAGVQTMGELYAAVGADDEAIRAFSLLRDAPSAGIRLNGAMAQAKALLAAERYADALPLFEEVLDAGGNSAEAKARSLVAEVGLVACQAKTGDAEEGIESVREIIDSEDPENAELFAMAYATLGNCYLAAGQNEDALLAFLHVDLLYPSQSRYRAEALYHLSRLWGEVGKGDRALQAKETLLSTYADTTWARKSDSQ